MTKNKIKGMFLGVALGDILGIPVEGFSTEKIEKIYGSITSIIPPSGHQKWLRNHKQGTWSDDSQLTIAVAEAMIDSNGFEDQSAAMDAQAKRHVEALRATVAGWGRTTTEAVRKLANGEHWSTSGIVTEAVRKLANGEHWSTSGIVDAKRKGSGLGNGVAMKIGPVGAYAAIDDDHYGAAVDFTMKLSQMTHGTSISASTGLAMMAAVAFCLKYEPKEFDESLFISDVVGAANLGKLVLPETIVDDVVARLEQLEDKQLFNRDKIITEWKGGCYCYDSIPFTLMFFIKNPHSVDTLFTICNAGGDTDSNCSMAGALLGALHGPEIFGDLPKQADPVQLAQVMDVAERFAEKFGFKE